MGFLLYFLELAEDYFSSSRMIYFKSGSTFVMRSSSPHALQNTVSSGFILLGMLIVPPQSWHFIVVMVVLFLNKDKFTLTGFQ